MELIIKNSNTKQLHHNTIIYPIQIKNIKNVYKRNIENKIITIKIQNMGKNIWTFIISNEIYKTNK